MDKKNINIILATDCGSTTTKAILIEYIENEFRLTFRGEAPTTVEAPFEDVTRGVINSILELEELSGRKILNQEKIITPSNKNEGVDVYISTSSAGGGLQMMVSGVVKNMTGESAQRAALGAGAIVMDILASNDKRLYHQKVKRIRELRPDMVLLSGGVDGGTISHVVELAEIIKTANPKPRLGMDYKLPIIYAGNKQAQDNIKETLDNSTDLIMVPNIRPTLEKENLKPSRDKIHDLFMDHVMAQAPGYNKLMEWADHPIMPTPGAVGEMIKKIAEVENISVVGVDIGGATTDVFSFFDGEFNRTVSANLGMSYSICNVLSEAGVQNVSRWVPFEIDSSNLTNRIANKMIRPTTIPQTLEDLKIEQALAREALRLSFIQHKEFAVSLKGIQQERTISDTFDQKMSGETIVDMLKLNLIVGSGGVLSHAPRRSQAMRMIIDSFLPIGFTEIAVDSIFMMPQLGVLSTFHEQAAVEVFHKDCLIKLGTCVSPIGEFSNGKVLFNYIIKVNDTTFEGEIKFGEIKLLDIPMGTYDCKIQLDKNVDLGFGKGQTFEGSINGGEVGIILDGRGREINFHNDNSDRINQIKKWSSFTNEYSKE
ncbi:MAG: methylaspartate mutase [Candidatus Pelagibacter sp. TMED273]|nr:MAG: methylaspartate mutase [Candidatus Pelagibacter sp. TMED273]|tara:strand:+ start:13087 stop:14880 length:1794 start_codon:yes stop_codon:yes gene_type:complete